MMKSKNQKLFSNGFVFLERGSVKRGTVSVCVCGIEGNEGVLEEIKRPRLLNISDLCPCGFSITSLLLYGSPLLPVDILYESGSIHIYM